MKQIAIITGYFITICIVGCLLAYPLYLVTGANFERIVSRTILILAVLLFYPACKCLNVGNMTSLGWVKTNAVKALTQSWALGFIMLLPISLVYFGCGYRVLEPTPITLTLLLSAFLSAALSGILIGLIEESVFRGLLQSQLSQSMNTITVIIIVSVIYSSVHFLQAPEHLSDQPIKWYSGFTMLSAAFANFKFIDTFIDAWIALFLAGIFLSLIRSQTKNLLWCIGIHAGWVTHIKLFKEFTDRDNSASCSYLASSYDNYVGELSTLLIIAILIVWRIIYKRNKANQ